MWFWLRKGLAIFVRGTHSETSTRYLLADSFWRTWCVNMGRTVGFVQTAGSFEPARYGTFFCRFGIETHLTVAYNPEANGKVERSHQTLVAALVKAAAFKSAQWVDLFPFALWADRSMIH